MEGAAYTSGPVEKSAGDLEDLKFGRKLSWLRTKSIRLELKGFKERFEKGESEVEVQKTAVEVADVQLGNIKAAFEKVGFDQEQRTFF